MTIASNRTITPAGVRAIIVRNPNRFDGRPRVTYDPCSSAARRSSCPSGSTAITAATTAASARPNGNPIVLPTVTRSTSTQCSRLSSVVSRTTLRAFHSSIRPLNTPA